MLFYKFQNIPIFRTQQNDVAQSSSSVWTNTVSCTRQRKPTDITRANQRFHRYFSHTYSGCLLCLLCVLFVCLRKIFVLIFWAQRHLQLFILVTLLARDSKNYWIQLKLYTLVPTITSRLCFVQTALIKRITYSYLSILQAY